MQVTAAYYRGKVVACGGYTGEEFTANCYELSSDLNEWLPIQSLPDTRLFFQTFKSSVIDDTWVLSGGDEFSTGVFAYDEIFSPLPSLPEGFSDHCQLTVNEKFIFFSGNTHTRDTFLFNWETQEYIQLEDMPEGVNDPACGILNNPFDGPEFLVATGYDAFIFSLKDLSWREARLFPVKARFLTSVNVDGGILAVGGAENFDDAMDTLYKFDEDTHDWTLLDKRLEIPRFYSAVVAVPDEFLQCQ